jgi:hypothetical protein
MPPTAVVNTLVNGAYPIPPLNTTVAAERILCDTNHYYYPGVPSVQGGCSLAGPTTSPLGLPQAVVSMSMMLMVPLMHRLLCQAAVVVIAIVIVGIAVTCQAGASSRARPV